MVEYCSTRANAETSIEVIDQKGIRCFHGDIRKDIQGVVRAGARIPEETAFRRPEDSICTRLEKIDIGLEAKVPWGVGTSEQPMGVWGAVAGYSFQQEDTLSAPVLEKAATSIVDPNR
jgi:hypothetical protein